MYLCADMPMACVSVKSRAICTDACGCCGLEVTMVSLSLGARGDANYTVSSSPEGKRKLSVSTSTTLARASHVFIGYSSIQLLSQQKNRKLVY
ncbi:hypothetical protein OXX80_006142 [Metschnikowia pulcherrima]